VMNDFPNDSSCLKYLIDWSGIVRYPAPGEWIIRTSDGKRVIYPTDYFENASVDDRITRALTLISSSASDDSDPLHRWHFDTLVKAMLDDQMAYEKWVLDWEHENDEKWDNWTLTYHTT